MNTAMTNAFRKIETHLVGKISNPGIFGSIEDVMMMRWCFCFYFCRFVKLQRVEAKAKDR